MARLHVCHLTGSSTLEDIYDLERWRRSCRLGPTRCSCGFFGCDENILSFYFFPIPFSFLFCSFLKSKLAREHGSYVKSASAGFSMVQKALRKKCSMSLVFRYFSSLRIYSLPSAPISWNLFSLPVAREPFVALFLWRFTNCAMVLFFTSHLRGSRISCPVTTPSTIIYSLWPNPPYLTSRPFFISQ